MLKSPSPFCCEFLHFFLVLGPYSTLKQQMQSHQSLL